MPPTTNRQESFNVLWDHFIIHRNFWINVLNPSNVATAKILSRSPKYGDETVIDDDTEFYTDCADAYEEAIQHTGEESMTFTGIMQRTLYAIATKYTLSIPAKVG